MSVVRTSTKVFAANWKMNIGPAEAQAFMTRFLQEYRMTPGRRILIFPPAVSIPAVSASVVARSDVAVGVQNTYHRDSGAFTGEISVPLAKSAGAQYALVGHSERRSIFGETDGDVQNKVASIVRHGLSPVLCVGEAREQRKAGRTQEFVGMQVRHGIAALTPEQLPGIMIAYEPIWAIGSGQTATPEQVGEVHTHIRFLLGQILGRDRADSVPILYGGSVTPATATPILDTPDVDGLLVGGASLTVESWLEIVRA